MKFLYTIFFAMFMLSIAAASVNDRNTASFIKLIDSTITSSADSLKLMEEKKLRLSMGKDLHVQKCQRCHVLYEPAEFRLKKWIRNLNEMKHKAELSKEQYDLILEYITENCKK